MSGESLSEWRSCEQVENGSPSTSPPFWDTDDDDDPGPKPSDLFGRHTWRIEKFSKEKKREMKSEPFEAGGYKWYILVYPQGCDVSNHLSLFLCVANHDKLLPGWSHFAQFTIAVSNMDPKKVKYSDTLHRFWKKEHDWGWKKFMELSKIQDGFLVDDVLEIIAQVQVIREKVDRPFRCLNRSYRRELLCVYMTNIEQIYRRFVEERKSKLSKLIEDRMRWSSFRAFWLAIDPSTRYHMSREKTDAILKILVKHFFVEKEVTSTLVMDSLYTGLKALEYQSKDKKGRTEVVELEELPAPIVHVDIDMFVLAGDVIALLERAALEPLPYQPVSPKDDKCSQSRTKDGSSGEVNKVSIEREERRLTELGQKILETFVLSHIFSGIEVAYQEAVALKRQEELIREEEAAGLLENEMKGKRGGGATEKEKRAKKKQAKQKKNNRKVKDREKEEKSDANILQRLRDERAIDDSDGLPSKQADKVTSEVDPLEEVASDLSDNIDGLVDVCQRYSSDKNSRPMIGVNDADSEIQNARTGKKKKYAEHNSTTCLAESAAVNIMQGKGNTNTAPEIKSPISPNRGKNQRNKATSSISFAQEADSLPSSIAGVSDRNMYGCGTAPKLDQETVLLTLKDQLRRLGQRLHEKEIEGRKLLKVHLGVVNSKTKTTGSSSSSSLEKPSNVLKRPEQSLGTTDTKTSAPPNEDAPIMTCTTNSDGVKSSTSTETKDGVMPNTIISTEAAPIVAPTVAPTGTTVELVLSKENVSSSTLQIDEAAPIPSRSPPIDRAAPFPPRSPQVDNAIPACPRSAQVDKAIAVCPGSPQVEKSSSVRPRSPQVEKPSSVPPRSPQVEKPSSVPPRSPKVDKVIPVPSGSPSTSSTSTLDAQKETISANFAAANGIATSKPTSIPLFQAPKSTVSATPPVQVSPLLSCSMSEAARSGNDPSHSAPSYVPQTYRNAIVGKPALGKTPASVAHQSTSLGQGNALSQSLSTYTSATSVMVPPVARNDQLSGRQRFMFGLGKSEALDSWHPWKCDGDANRHLWRDDSPYQQTNSDAFRHPWGDDSYQQAKDYEMEKLGRFGGLQPTQLQASSVSHQSQGPTVEEFPHLDIINELLEEEQSNGSMPESLPHDYHTFGSPFSLRGNLADSQMTSASTSGRFNSTEQYYGEAYPRAYDSTRTLHGMRGAQFSTLDAYSNGRTVWTASKPWLYNYPNPTVNLGINTNGVSQQLAQYANLTSGVNGDFLHRRANGHW